MQEDRIWAEEHGLDLRRARVTEFETLVLVMEAVLAGHGVSIMPTAVVAREVASGNLEVLLEEQDSPLSYHMLTLPGRMTPNLKAFMAWLRRAA